MKKSELKKIIKEVIAEGVAKKGIAFYARRGSSDNFELITFFTSKYANAEYMKDYVYRLIPHMSGWSLAGQGFKMLRVDDSDISKIPLIRKFKIDRPPNIKL